MSTQPANIQAVPPHYPEANPPDSPSIEVVKPTDPVEVPEICNCICHGASHPSGTSYDRKDHPDGRPCCLCCQYCGQKISMLHVEAHRGPCLAKKVAAMRDKALASPSVTSEPPKKSFFKTIFPSFRSGKKKPDR